MSDIIFWGLTASPFQLKMQVLADYAGATWQRWPDQASRLDALKTAVHLRRTRRAQSIERFPGRVAELDEYPEVPYYSLDGRQFFYDSTGLAHHLDQLAASPEQRFPGDILNHIRHKGKRQRRFNNGR